MGRPSKYPQEFSGQQTLDALPGALSEHERLELKRLRKEVAETGDPPQGNRLIRQGDDPVSRFSSSSPNIATSTAELPTTTPK